MTIDVGFIGLGEQGEPMARAIAAAGWRLHVWARRPASVARLDDVACTVHGTVADLGASCELVGLCLGTDADVEEVAVGQGLLGALRPGAILANHGTGAPSVAVALAERGREVGVHVLDAPVSGGAARARRSLTVMVGGDVVAVERARPVFAAFGAVVAHLGGPGAGQLSKLLNNSLYASNVGAVAEAVALADVEGIDVAALVPVLLHSSGGSFALQAVSRYIPVGTEGHAQALIAKDVVYLAEALDSRLRGPAGENQALLITARRGVAAIPELVRRLGSAEEADQLGGDD